MAASCHFGGASAAAPAHNDNRDSPAGRRKRPENWERRGHA
nr:MAG TPA: hypothetical protein [Caudoviricetes sp.]